MNKIKLYFANLENKFKIAVLKKLGWEKGIIVLDTQLFVKVGSTSIVPRKEWAHYDVDNNQNRFLFRHIVGHKDCKTRTVEIANHTLQEAWLKEVNKLKFWKK